jgi:hypothetical protein
MRATKVLLEMMDDCKSVVAKDGSVQKKTLNALSEALGGKTRSVSPHTIICEGNWKWKS